MTSLIAVKFFKVQKKNRHVTEFDEALVEAIKSGPTPVSRERNVDQGYPIPLIVRLERLDVSRDYFSGELIRKQTNNIPPEANDTGLTRIRLGRNGGLGLSAAFRYHKPTKVLAIQNNNHSVSTSRLGTYLNLINTDLDFEFNPLARADAWERFNRKKPRKLKMKIAAPADFHLSGPEESIGSGIATIGEAVHAPYIMIEVSMGRSRGSLATSMVKGLIEKITAYGHRKPGTVQALTVSMNDDDGNDLIDFLEEHLVVKGTVELEGTTPEENYSKRAAFIENALKQNMRYIIDAYGRN